MPVKSCTKEGVKGWNHAEIAWAAGLLEGEGCFHSTGGRPRVSVNMTDEDVLVRLKGVLGCGRLSGPREVNPGYKPVWRYDLSRMDQVYAVTAALYSQLGERRKAQARDLIKLYASKPPRGYKVELICEECGVQITRLKKRVRSEVSYCSQRCAGKAVGRMSPCR